LTSQATNLTEGEPRLENNTDIIQTTAS
jgi:hypothetical protein